MEMIAWNDDVLLEILLRLPAKSLIRFKLVCKRWLVVISTNELCHLHTIHNPNPQRSLILQTHTSHIFFYFNPILNPHKLVPYSFTNIPNPKIMSSCNGLLLMQSDDHQEKEYCYVCNPTTKQSRKIILANNDKYTDVIGLNLAFDPSKSLHYKIVCIRASRRTFRSGLKRTCLIEVYDSETCTWRTCYTTNIQADFATGIHWNDAIHWENHPAHLYLNVDKNVMRTMPHAVVPWHGGDGVLGVCRCQLQESNGRLYHLIMGSHLGDKSIAVYELEEDCSQWLLKYHDGFVHPGIFCILSFVWGDDGEMSGFVIHVSGKISIYRFLDKSYEELVDLINQPIYQQDSLQFDSKDVFQFGESMAPV